MTLPKWATTVTPFSKILALIIFITFPIIGFYLGYSFGQLKIGVLNQEISQNTPAITIAPTLSPTILKSFDENHNIYHSDRHNFDLITPKTIGNPIIYEDKFSNYLPSFNFGASTKSSQDNINILISDRINGIQRGGIIDGISYKLTNTSTLNLINKKLVINEYLIDKTNNEFSDYQTGKKMVEASIIINGSEMVYMKNMNPLNDTELEFSKNTMIDIAKNFKFYIIDFKTLKIVAF